MELAIMGSYVTF